MYFIYLKLSRVLVITLEVSHLLIGSFGLNINSQLIVCHEMIHNSRAFSTYFTIHKALDGISVNSDI